MIALLLDEGADPNREHIQRVRHGKISIIHWAAKFGDEVVGARLVQRLIFKGAYINGYGFRRGEKCDPAVLHTLRLHGLIAKDLHEKLKHFQDRFGIVLSNGLYCEAEWTRRMKFLKVSQITISPFSISL